MLQNPEKPAIWHIDHNKPLLMFVQGDNHEGVYTYWVVKRRSGKGPGDDVWQQTLGEAERKELRYDQCIASTIKK